jgi:hypothetical protein
MFDLGVKGFRVRVSVKNKLEYTYLYSGINLQVLFRRITIFIRVFCKFADLKGLNGWGAIFTTLVKMACCLGCHFN